MIMDMVLIYMGADDKGMVSFCELQRQLPADLIGFFRRNFAGLKCLTEMVGDHIVRTLVSAGQICILSFGKKKERKSLEGKIELLEDLEKRLHRSMGRIVKREGYPNVQSFQKVYNKAEELIMEYNEELRAWKNQTKPKKENPLEQPQKASVLEKLHRYQQEGRQQPKRSVKKKSMDRER